MSPHGTYARYTIHKCRCEACREANARYSKRNKLQRATGAVQLVDAEPVRRHLRELMALGMGWKRVARAAGVATGTTYAILYGKHRDKPDHPEHRPVRKRVRRDIADKLLAVELDVADGVSIDATGTTRRLQALVAAGNTQRSLATRLGWSAANLGPIVLGQRAQVTVGTARAVRALYDECWQPAQPNVRAVRLAARRGWLPPMAWDDGSIDDPSARGSVGVGRRTAAATVEDVEHLLSCGQGPRAISQQLGRSLNDISIGLRRAGRFDLVAAMRLERAA